MTIQNIRPGFDDPVMRSQSTFRKVLEAMSHPGRIVDIDNTPEGLVDLSPAATAVCLTLVDFETPIWLDTKALSASDYLKFHCSCPITELSTAAQFAVIAAPQELTSFETFNLGSNEYPDRAATLIIEVESLSNAEGVTLTGPGIEHSAKLSVSGVSETFWPQVQNNSALFPRGVDLVLTCGKQLAALPRTTQVEV